jgi:hypothetical protein
MKSAHSESEKSEKRPSRKRVYMTRKAHEVSAQKEKRERKLNNGVRKGN